MPLSKVRQAEWMKEYRKRKKSGITQAPVIPEVRPSLDDLRGIIKSIECREKSSVIPSVIPEIPLYDPYKHHAGDTVRMMVGRREKTVVIPKLDADGNAIPEY